MAIHSFELRSEFIPLNDLIKLLGLVPSGGSAN
jgi:ribosome-associated protein YbcJ (S4-like RNA binding protein)